MSESLVSLMSPRPGVVARDTLLSDRTGTAAGVVESVSTPLPVDYEKPQILVWGTGQGARLLLEHLRPAVQVVACVDSDADRWGDHFLGTLIVAPSAARDLTFDTLVIASAFAADIAPKVLELGLCPAHRMVAWTGPKDNWRRPELFRRQVLQIGITSVCNLMCQHCPRDTDPNAYRTLELPHFRQYLSQFDPLDFQHLLVSDFGEVTILKNFLDYLRNARALGWRNVGFVSNATNGRRELWEAIFGEDLVRRLVISLESARPEEFEQIRGFPWARFSRNLSTISESIRQHGNRVELTLNAVSMKSNLEGLPDLVDLAAHHGARLTFVHLNPSNLFNNPLGTPDNHMDQAPRDEVIRVFQEVARRAAALGVTLTLPEQFPELVATPDPEQAPAPWESGHRDLLCTQPLTWVEVDDRGNVYPCCQMAKRTSMGSLETQTFDEITTGSDYRRLLDGLRPGGTPLDVCRECNMYRGKNF